MKKNIIARAQKLKEVRDFFFKKNILELDCNALMPYAPIDANIDCIALENKVAYLHTSPEYALKKALSQGIGDCYFLGHVYRKDEKGRLHNPEFTMVEWYRVGFDLPKMIEETAEFLTLFLKKLPLEILTYQKAFETYAGICPFKASLKTLQNLAESPWSRRECLDYIMSFKIEPHLGEKKLTAIINYPPDQAALAKVTSSSVGDVASRFEIYYQGVELANGYHELSDAKELEKRFHHLNEARKKEGKTPYEIDPSFLQCLKTLPDCSGVALGFDRALMLHLQESSIQKVTCSFS